MKSIYLRALYAALPALVFGGCDCGGCESHRSAPSPSRGCTAFSCVPIDFTQKCTTAEECQPDFFNPIDACSVFACVGGRCTTTPGPDGPAPPDEQSPGDCVTVVCSGGTLISAAAADPPTIDDPCRIGACAGMAPTFVNAPDGIDCTTGADTAVCVGGRCLRFPDDIGGTGGNMGTGGMGTGGMGVGGMGVGGMSTGGAGTGGMSTSGTGTGGMGAGGKSGTGGADAGPSTCIHCSEVLYGGSFSSICESSTSIYAALAQCICVTTCADVCGDNLCAHSPATSGCMVCVGSVAGGCGNELTACNDDF